MNLNKSIVEAYNLLDVEPDAEPEEIEAAFEHMKRLYGSGPKDISIQLLEGEWSEEERTTLLERINRAYERIVEYLKTRDADELDETLAEVVLEKDEASPEYTGQELRRIREEKGIGLHDIYQQTELPYKLFAHIEQEKYSKLPEAGLLRWYVSVYAKILGLDAKKVADDYMKRFRRSKTNQPL